MDYYEASQPGVVIQCDLEDEEADDPGSAPFVEENPCLVCGHKAFANFIDISYTTSCTSTTATHVKKRLRDILGKIWTGKSDNQTLCLACYDLVDRFDSLESQLTSIRENICDKYQRTTHKTNYVKPKGTAGSAPTTATARKKTAKVKRNSVKKPKYIEEDDDMDNGNDNVFTVEICEGADPDPDYNNTSAEDPKVAHITMPPLQCAPLDPPEEPNLNVYDEHHQLLQRGERIRLGANVVDEEGLGRYVCAYCPQAWVDIGSLHTHVHSYHQPEVVDVVIPLELGLGNTMNCGVEIQNCQEPSGNPKPWSCLFCDQAFRARTNMSSHFKDKHTPYKPFSCTECGEAFRKGIDLNRHKLYFCEQRTVTFAPKRKYKKRDFKEKSVSPVKAKDGAIITDTTSVVGVS